MTKTKIYDLEDRTFLFAKETSDFCKTISNNISNFEYIKQLIRSSSSVGANYIEANEALSKKDFLMRVKICRKEAKESVYWLRLLVDTNADNHKNLGEKLINEAIELKKIFSSIIDKSK